MDFIVNRGIKGVPSPSDWDVRGAEGQILAGIWAVLFLEPLLWCISVLQWLKSTVLGFAPADVAPEFPSSSSRRYSCYLRLLLCAGLEPYRRGSFPNRFPIIWYACCMSPETIRTRRVNNSKLRATEHKKPQTKTKPKKPTPKPSGQEEKQRFPLLIFLFTENFCSGTAWCTESENC